MTTVSAGSTDSYTFTTNDSVRFDIDTGEVANVRVSNGSAGFLFSSPINTTRIIGPFPVGAVMTVTAVRGDVDYTIVDQDTDSGIPLSADYTLTASDNGKTFVCSTALTITVPSGLSPMPSVIVWPPSSGNTSVARGGSATLNGASTTLTRSLSSNPIGFAIAATPAADAYGVSGS